METPDSVTVAMFSAGVAVLALIVTTFNLLVARRQYSRAGSRVTATYETILSLVSNTPRRRIEVDFINSGLAKVQVLDIGVYAQELLNWVRVESLVEPLHGPPLPFWLEGNERQKLIYEVPDGSLLARPHARIMARLASGELIRLRPDKGKNSPAASFKRVGPDEEYLVRSADAGDIKSMNNLGAILFNRGEVERATGLFKKAAEAGNVVAMKNLGVALEGSEPDESRRWFLQAASSGNVEAMAKMGNIAKEEGRTSSAQEWWERAAKGDHVPSMTMLGLSLMDHDADASEKWLEAAASAGDLDAMVGLAEILSNRDPDGAERWMRKAATEGHVLAIHNLGVMLDSRDSPEAEEWLRKAAANGDGSAMNSLGVLMVKRGDPVGAETWFREAVKCGDEHAADNLKALLAGDGSNESAE